MFFFFGLVLLAIPGTPFTHIACFLLVNFYVPALSIHIFTFCILLWFQLAPALMPQCHLLILYVSTCLSWTRFSLESSHNTWPAFMPWTHVFLRMRLALSPLRLPQPRRCACTLIHCFHFCLTALWLRLLSFTYLHFPSIFSLF